MRRFARYWDLIGNSGNFVETLGLLWKNVKSAFDSFMHLTEWLHMTSGRKHGIALSELVEFLFRYLTEQCGQNPPEVAGALWRDYQRGGRSDRPAFLRPYISEENSAFVKGAPELAPKRQARHLAASQR